MRMSPVSTAIFAYAVIGQAALASAQVDQQRAQEFFKEAHAVCERDSGRLWGVSICMPMVIGDARTQTFATSQPPPDAPRPKLIGLLNGPIQWGDAMWAALTWDTIAAQAPRLRSGMLIHESFHIVQMQLGLGVGTVSAEHLDTADGRYWLRLEWRALARALRESGDARALAIRDALAFRRARHARFPGMAETERAVEINEGLASYTQAVLPAQSPADAIANTLDELTAAEGGESFVRTFAYASGPAYGLLLDAASPGWTRTVRASDDVATLLMRALAIQPVADGAAAAARYGGAQLRAAEDERDQQRHARIATLRRQFVEAPVLVMPGGGGGLSNSLGAVVIPDVGTIYFGAYRMTGPWGALEAGKGVLVATDGRSRRLPGPIRRDDSTVDGDGWTVKAAPGWVIREGARRGDYELVRQQESRIGIDRDLLRQGSDDEQQLLMIQQQLARAWVQQDRALIERVLAPEWSVTQADGTIRSRAMVIDDAFVARTVSIESMVVDDVTVTILGDTAIVRGRTQATGLAGGQRGTARLRFTDTFIKRNGQWQAVASHATLIR